MVVANVGPYQARLYMHFGKPWCLLYMAVSRK
jgi:hypothetical protein